MSILGKFFKSDDTVSTKNIEILNALKILQNSSLPYNERVVAGNLLSPSPSGFFSSKNVICPG